MRILFAMGLLARVAWSCSCAVSPVGNPPCQAVWRYDAVFTGTVESIADAPPGLPAMSPVVFPQRQVRIRITGPYRGIEGEMQDIVVETGLGGGDCGYPFERGREYLVYASRKAGGGYSTGICSPTRPVEDASEDMNYLRRLPDTAPTTDIRVTAYDIHGTPRGGGRFEWPGLAGATITIDGPGGRSSAATDGAGRHVFAGVRPGDYKVEVALEGYSVGYPIPLVKAPAKGCAEVTVPLRLDRIIRGRVLTNEGMPAAGVVVQAVPARPRHESDLPMAVDSATTDREGWYELRQLAAGDYYVGIALDRGPTPAQPYTRWFYPNTEDPRGAAIVHISDQPEVQRADWTRPDPQHDRPIRGTVYWPDGHAAEGVNIVLEDPRLPWQVFMVATTTNREGRFEAHGFDGTTYRVHAVKPGTDAVSAEPAPLAPGGEPADLRLVLARRGSSLTDAGRQMLEDWRNGRGLR